MFRKFSGAVDAFDTSIFSKLFYNQIVILQAIKTARIDDTSPGHDSIKAKILRKKERGMKLADCMNKNVPIKF